MFESEYVTPGRGQEKGGVENLVGYVRRNFLVPPPEFDDYDDLNAYLVDCCDRDARERQRLGRTVQELWQEEQARLRPLPEKLPAACVSRVAKVNRRQQVRFGGNWYSVPPRLCGPPGDRPRLCLPGGDGLAGPGGCLPCPQLWPGGRGPGSAPLSAGLIEEARRLCPGHADPQWPLPAVYEAYHRQLQERRESQNGTREYIRILMLLQDHPLQEVTAAVEQAAAMGLYGYEAVKNLLSGQPEQRLAPALAGVAQPGGPL